MNSNLEDRDIDNLADLRVSDDSFESSLPTQMKLRSSKGYLAGFRPPRRSRKVLSQVQQTVETKDAVEDAVEAYFMQDDKKWGLSKTSNHTLSELCLKKSPGVVDPLTLEQLIQQFKPAHESASKTLQKEVAARSFFKWPFYLREGFNIILYGIGSKRELLESFRRTYLEKLQCIVVHGYNPSVTLKHILHSVWHDCLRIPDQPKKLSEQLRHITRLMGSSDASNSPLYLIIHNIDGPGLRNAKSQAVLAHLASIPNVHLVASIDHINMPVLWSHDELARFSWIWEDCTTLADYTCEASYSNSRILQNILSGISEHGAMGTGSGGSMLASLRQVAASLTQNARDIFRMIAEHQMESPLHETRGVSVGMPLEDLYWRCRDAFLTNSEVTLRAQLAEFRDHKLLKIKKNPDGTELLLIPMDNSSLKKFVENFDSFC